MVQGFIYNDGIANIIKMTKQHKIKGQNQHYVPQLLLKNFADKNQIYVFDKHTGRITRKSIRSTCSAEDFYTVHFSELVNEQPKLREVLEKHPLIVDGKRISTDEIIDLLGFSAEDWLSSIETNVGSVIKNIINKNSLTGLTHLDKFLLCYFVATQILRTMQQRQHMADIITHMKEKLKYFYNPSCGLTLDEFLERETEKNFLLNQKLLTIEVFKECTLDYAICLIAKKMQLFRSPANIPFYISDHPVIFHNSRNFEPYGNIGLAVPGIEIYMPISSHLCLGFISRDIIFTLPYNVLSFNINEQEMTEVNVPIQCSKDNLEFLNYRQILFAERYLCCENMDFDFVKKVLREHPQLKHSQFRLQFS